jgi:NADP-dependent 3-hydroxy acid dehydrogenase YdfG
MTGMDLTNRTAVITGASSGIGAATARALAAAGAHVTLVARRADRIAALASELGGDAVAADVADRAALDAIEREFDLVIANAGVMLPSPAEISDASDLERMLDANVLGLVNTVRAFAPGLLAAGSRGEASDLVVISSIGAGQSFPGYSGYTGSKAFATQFTRNVRLEWGPRGVRVTTIEPGLTHSELRDHVTGTSKQELDGMFEAIPAIRSEDVAETIVFATSRPLPVNLAHIEVTPASQP